MVACLLAAVLWTTVPVPAQVGPAGSLTLDTSRIATAPSAMVDEGRTAGASVLVWKKGHEAYFRVGGLRRP